MAVKPDHLVGQIKLMDRFETKLLRRIADPTYATGTQRQRKNRELYTAYDGLSIMSSLNTKIEIAES